MMLPDFGTVLNIRRLKLCG